MERDNSENKGLVDLGVASELTRGGNNMNTADDFQRYKATGLEDA